MSTTKAFISILGPCIEQYLAHKQALGRQCVNEHNVLKNLDTFLADQATDLTAAALAGWSASIGHLTPTVRRRWLSIARNACLYRQRREFACFVPDLATFPRSEPPRHPHIFTEEQIVQLLRVTDNMQKRSTSPLRREVFRLALVLLYTAGLRRGEIVRLSIADYDANEHTLIIQSSKFHKSRVVPLSRDASNEMDAYIVRRRQLPCSPSAPLLCCCHGGLRHYTGAGLAQGLRQIFRLAGVYTATGNLPRVHDMRHTFAHAALLRWYRDRAEVEAKLPALAAYMGHVSVVSTQYYLSFFAPFAESASDLFARHCEPFIDGAGERGAP